MRLLSILTISLLCILPSRSALCDVLTQNATWQGNIELRDDIIIPSGITLTIHPGTFIRVYPAENTRIDPEFMSHQTEILVRGEVSGIGRKGERIILSGSSRGDDQRWAGFIVDGGKVALGKTDISGAEAAITVLGGHAELADSGISGNRYGLVGQSPEADIRIAASKNENNEYGLVNLDGAKIEKDVLK